MNICTGCGLSVNGEVCPRCGVEVSTGEVELVWVSPDKLPYRIRYCEGMKLECRQKAFNPWEADYRITPYSFTVMELIKVDNRVRRMKVLVSNGTGEGYRCWFTPKSFRKRLLAMDEVQVAVEG